MNKLMFKEPCQTVHRDFILLLNFLGQASAPCGPKYTISLCNSTAKYAIILYNSTVNRVCLVLKLKVPHLCLPLNFEFQDSEELRNGLDWVRIIKTFTLQEANFRFCLN